MLWTILAYILAFIFGILCLQNFHKKRNKGFYIWLVFLIAAFIVGILNEIRKENDSTNSTKEIIKAIEDKKPPLEPASIGVVLQTPETIPNPVIESSPDSKYVSINTALINKGKGVAFNIKENTKMVVMDNGEFAYVYPDDGLPKGFNKEIFMMPGDVITLRTHLIKKEEAKKTGTQILYYCLRVNYSDSLSKSKTYRLIFDVSGLPVNTSLRIADSDTWDKIEKFLVDSKYW